MPNNLWLGLVNLVVGGVVGRRVVFVVVCGISVRNLEVISFVSSDSWNRQNNQ